MSALRVVFNVIGYVSMGSLWLYATYVEWAVISQSFWQLFNPFLHMQIALILIGQPMIWMMLAVGGASFWAASRFEAKA